ncbi:IQ motif, EF-hand binding site [Corchorus capsularis]|uniref:IQ motif, EF-hand binding site n=1 Tax=Corchorus capsularis TaxID=210143 RepID=A0A1R3ILR1_COCAP|nr:IQ motif, EF-hand binding site [Corchorus capsularis]
MKPISRSRKNEAFHKYLKPGALAQLRDSKITARSHKLNSVRLNPVPTQIPPSQTQIQISDFDQIPGFLKKTYGDLNQIILKEAQHRWLRPAEVCEILINHAKFRVLDKPQFMPPAQSMLLFDRHAFRYFRKDGHKWKRKSDGKTIKEAHEKLKVGGEDVLHCYYAHGEDDGNFQRRCYWMIEKDFERYVFVHYRQVEEGYNRSGSSRSLTGSLPSLVHANSPLQYPIYGSISLTASMKHEVAGFPESGRTPPGSWSIGLNHDNSSTAPCFSPGIHYNMTNSTISMPNQKLYVEQPIAGELITHEQAEVTTLRDVLDELLSDDDDDDVQAAVGESLEIVIQDYDFDVAPQDDSSLGIADSSSEQIEINESKGGLKKLDSFGKWMDKEMGGDCDDFLIASSDHSINYWNPLDMIDQSDVSEGSSLSHQMQLDHVYPLDPSLVEQLFTIADFAPNWAYSGVETKVLIIGRFLQSKELSDATNWCCMFGEIEVSAEVLGKNVIRCQVPCHSPGHVPFYITCCNRLACSEIKSFEFREKPPGFSFDRNVKTTAEEEILHLKVGLAKLLDIVGPRRKWPGCSVEECDKCRLTNDMVYWMGIACPNDGMQYSKDGLIQNLLKERLCEWLLCKFHEIDGEDVRILDEEGQGVIHLAASLGYNWAMGPIIATGISPNFRDRRGRTGLHWASYFGREETVITLIELGANPGAIDDPTSCFPGGRTAADLASSRGHKGIAGFLAEIALRAEFSSLTMGQGHETTQNAIETATSNESCSLKRSLAAVRNSAHAAALIQEALRTRDRQLLTKGNDDMSNKVSLEQLGIVGSLNRHQKTTTHFGDYLHTAAAKIQHKYRGWKGRKEFLKIRNRIVKIQAHVRGHQVRKQYKMILWSVGIIKKLILWRRKSAGQRGRFRAQESIDSTRPVEETGDDEYEHLRLGRQQKINGVEKALARVQSMARDQEARDQYMRLTTKFGESMVSSTSTNVGSGQEGKQLAFLGDQ